MELLKLRKSWINSVVQPQKHLMQLKLLKLKQISQTKDGVTALTTPPSNVLKYTLADDSWIAVRPSGTEPKIKFYIATVGKTLEEAEGKIATIEKEINYFVEA